MASHFTREKQLIIGNRQRWLLASLEGRINEDFLVTRQFRGNIFNVPVEDGSRTYYRMSSRDTDPWQNKAAAALGVLLSVLGLTGIGPEKKLS